MDAINPAKLNKIPQTGAKIKMEKFEDKLAQIVKTLTYRAEREVCEYGSFKNVKENIPSENPKDIIKDISLQITPLPNVLKGEIPDFEKLRYLELSATGSKGQKENVILKRGTKEEILKALAEENLPDRLKKNINDFKLSFMED